MLVILPFWTSVPDPRLRLDRHPQARRPAEPVLQWTCVIDEPLQIMNTNTPSISASSIPTCPSWCCRFMRALEKLDVLAAGGGEDLGCPPWAFWKITVPLSLPGVIAGCFLVFIPAVGEFVIPDLLGGSDTLMIGKTLWEEFFSNRDWPVASAVAVILLLVLIVPIVLFQAQQQRQQERERGQ
jgi:putrescine transport system permease protein